MELNLNKPIIFFDLETTGTNITRDRIVEVSILKIMPDGKEISRTRRINPEMPIPPEATACTTSPMPTWPASLRLSR